MVYLVPMRGLGLNGKEEAPGRLRSQVQVPPSVWVSSNFNVGLVGVLVYLLVDLSLIGYWIQLQ